MKLSFASKAVANENNRVATPCDVTREERTLRENLRHGHPLDGRFAKSISNLKGKQNFSNSFDTGERKKKVLQIS